MRDGVLGLHPAVERLAHPAEDEHVEVHRQAKQDHEQEQRQPRCDPARGLEAEQAFGPVMLEHQLKHAVRRPNRQQVERDRLDRDHDRPERDEQEQERHREHEREDDRGVGLHRVVEVLRARGLARHVHVHATEGADGLRDQVAAELLERVHRHVIGALADQRHRDHRDVAGAVHVNRDRLLDLPAGETVALERSDRLLHLNQQIRTNQKWKPNLTPNSFVVFKGS